MISTTHLTEAIVQVTDTLVDGYDIVGFLGNLAEHAAAISGAEAVGMLLADQRDQLRVMASSNETGELLELLQTHHAEGPCWDCFHSGSPVVNTDLQEAVDRWPKFAPAALAMGFQSVHAFPMRLRDDTIGALGIFGTADVSFSDNEVRVVRALADLATIAILQERAANQTEIVTEQLQAALNSRIIIEQAKGAVAQREGITPDEAFQVLKRRARTTGTRLVDLARAAVEGPDRPE